MGGHGEMDGNAGRQAVLQQLFAGSIAGGVAKTSIAPIERVKILFQVSCGRAFTIRKTVDTIMHIYKHEGFRALWKGNGATLVRIMPYSAIQFASHTQFKQMLSGGDEKNLTVVKRLLAGSLAGGASTVCTYPLDVLRARVAVQFELSHEYTGLRGAFNALVRQDGYAALYRGLVPTLAGIMPYAGISFYSYEALKSRFVNEEEARAGSPTVNRMACGAVAGLMGQCSTYPLDVVRRRMQTQGAIDNGIKYTSIAQSLRHIVAKEGVRRGLFKGISLNFVKGPISVGLSFTTFDFIRGQLEKLSARS